MESQQSLIIYTQSAINDLNPVFRVWVSLGHKPGLWEKMIQAIPHQGHPT